MTNKCLNLVLYRLKIRKFSLFSLFSYIECFVLQVGLFHSIADGLKEAKVMVVFVSDQVTVCSYSFYPCFIKLCKLLALTQFVRIFLDFSKEKLKLLKTTCMINLVKKYPDLYILSFSAGLELFLDLIYLP